MCVSVEKDNKHGASTRRTDEHKKPNTSTRPGSTYAVASATAPDDTDDGTVDTAGGSGGRGGGGGGGGMLAAPVGPGPCGACCCWVIQAGWVMAMPRPRPRPVIPTPLLVPSIEEGP